jgi:hypothetical protein
MWVRPYAKTSPNSSPLYTSLQNFTLNISTPGTNDGALYIKNKFYFAQTDAQSQSLWTPSGSVEFKKWNHVVLTAQHGGVPNAVNKFLTSSLSLYVNGVKMSAQSSSRHMGFAVRSNGNPLPPMIGRDRLPDGSDRYANMDLSQMKIYYNKALTQTEILDLYNDTRARYDPPALTSMKILASLSPIDAGAITYSMNLYFSDVGITAPSYSISDLQDNTYTGADLNPNVHDVVYIANNGVGVGNAALANNLKTYMQNGGGVVFAPYIGGGDTYNPGGSAFDAALLPYTNKNASVVNSLTPKSLVVNDATHPIISASGVSTGDFVGQTNVYIGFQESELRPEATLLLSQYYSANTPWLTVQTYASASRVAYHNYYFPQAQNPGLAAIQTKRVLVHSLRWAARVI